MLERIVTAAVGLVVFFAALFLGNIAFNIAVCIVIAAGLFEIHKAIDAHPCLFFISEISAALMILGLSLPMTSMYIYINIMIMLYVAVIVFLHGRSKYTEVLSSMGLTLYVVISFAALASIRSNFGGSRVLLVFLIAWITDTSAYFGGYFFGKHKLAPVLSPKKTVEGAVSGVVGCVAVGILYLFVYKIIKGYSIGIPVWSCAVICFIGSILSQIGDLAASAIKRDAGIKDFGKILPGHGGLIDRFDSVMFVAPVLYYFFVITLR